MKFIQEKPPIWDKIVERFPGLQWETGFAIAYGDTIYATYKLRPDVAVHESVHIEQQAHMDKDAWWDKYLYDVNFRAMMEEPAYRAQAKFIRESVPDKNQRHKLIHLIAQDLSGAMYGNMMTYSDALKLLS